MIDSTTVPNVTATDIYIEGLRIELSLAIEAEKLLKQKPKTDTALKQLSDYQAAVDHQIALTKPPDRLANFYTSSSPVVYVEHTDYPVRGNEPPCGNKVPQLDKQADAYIEAINATASALIALPGVGWVASAIIFVLGAAASLLIDKFHKFQENCNCVHAPIMIPACLNEGDVNIEAWVGQNEDPFTNTNLGNPYERAVRDDFQEWRHVDVPYFSKPFKLKTKTTPGDEGRSCEFKLIVVQLRNWSHTRNLRFMCRAFWDAPMRAGCSCADFSLISRRYTDSYLEGAMNQDLLFRYLGYYYHHTDPQKTIDSWPST